MVHPQNSGIPLDYSKFENVNIHMKTVKEQGANLMQSRSLTKECETAWLLKAVTLIDLTTLAGDDTASNVTRLCAKACHPIAPDLLECLGFKYNDESPIHTAAVCVYPAKANIASEALKRMQFGEKINVAAVATGFPSGQYPLATRCAEIAMAVKAGASEIDIVIDRSLVLTGKWEELYYELKQMKHSCGTAHMKAILATGELSTLTNVYKASMVAMMAGSDFIKTSTGKESVNATIPFGIVMSRAIIDYYNITGIKVGLKPAGGIRTSSDAISWLILVKELLGDAWLSPELFRFGASGLLTDIEYNLYQYVTGKKPIGHRFTLG